MFEPPIYTIKSAGLAFGNNQLFRNVEFYINRGDKICLVGRNGCGISTLLNLMGLLDAPTMGMVEINGIRTEGMKDKELAAFRNRNLGFVFQSFHLINS